VAVFVVTFKTGRTGFLAFRGDDVRKDYNGARQLRISFFVHWHSIVGKSGIPFFAQILVKIIRLHYS
jgi:hypothetical protein